MMMVERLLRLNSSRMARVLTTYQFPRHWLPEIESKSRYMHVKFAMPKKRRENSYVTGTNSTLELHLTL